MTRGQDERVKRLRLLTMVRRCGQWVVGMTYDDLISLYGNGAKAGKALGYSRQAISRWKAAGIPFEQQFRIQLKTKGKLKATLPPERRA